uniref:Retrotransposon gag domain-containing protein n=1 Tax=Fagus sylvatica TaxID=28930 RepID=A0A2N9GVF9_FAGSY
MDALLTMKLEDNETIKEYSTRFWETYNDIDGRDEEVAVRTFKLGLHPDSGLRQSLTKRPAPTVGKLMHRIDEFIRVEEDGVSGEAVEQKISISDNDLRDVQLPHNNPLVITLRIGNYDVQRALIDQGSFAEPTVPLGKTVLPVLASPINLQMEFKVVKASSPYNAIMGHDWLHRAIPSTLHQKLRFPTKDGFMELNGDQVTAKRCVLAATKRKDTAEAEKPRDL